jgi:hypothetical protein
MRARAATQSRRELLKTALITVPGLFLGESLTLLAASDSSRLSVEVYIWKQLLSRQHRTLDEGLGEIFSTAKAAGFQNIELDDGFFKPELSAHTLSLLQTNRLSAPSVYVRGAMHEMVVGGETEQRALMSLRLPGKRDVKRSSAIQSPSLPGKRRIRNLSPRRCW